MREVCESNMCTACGACENICNKEAIIRIKRWDGSWYMSIDENRCVNCNLCRKVCPSINESLLNEPMAAFAGWSTDSNRHRNSASGGIASELYMYAIRKGWYFVGVQLDRNFEAHYQIGNAKCDIEKFRNSKYTFSYMDDIFKKIEAIIRDNIKVIFVGLPCQVAAIKKYCALKKLNIENLVTVDIVCHGTPSRRLWNDYKEWLEKKNKSKPIEFSFRYKDARWRLYPCMAKFTDGRVRVNTQDVRLFTTLFFTNLTYRECCYHCQYASLKREGDITLGDFWGFEDVMPAIAQKWNIKASQGVSLVMIHSDKGKLLWDEVIKNEDAVLCEPCLSEKYVKYQHNLSSPTEKPVLADKFKEDYKKYGFDYVIKKYANYNFRGKIRFALSRFYHERISKS